MRSQGRWGALWTAALLGAGAAIVVSGGWAQATSRVCLAQADRILMPDSALTPTWVYPEGKVDYFVVEALLDQAMASLTDETSVRTVWSQLFRPNDRVGIQIDVDGLPVHQALIEAVVRRLTRTGIQPANIIIYAGEENGLYYAGFDLRRQAGGVQVMGSDSEGFRGGLSRIVLDHCTAIINLARLRADREIGMSGALANCLSSVPHVERERLRRAPESLPAAAARATLKRKTKLHIMDALRPAYAAGVPGEPPKTWLYGAVMVSYDPVAIDAVGRDILVAKVREEDPEAAELTPPVGYLEPACERYRLGECDRAKIDLTTTTADTTRIEPEAPACSCYSG